MMWLLALQAKDGPNVVVAGSTRQSQSQSPSAGEARCCWKVWNPHKVCLYLKTIVDQRLWELTLGWLVREESKKTKRKKKKDINNRVRRSKNISKTIKIDGMMLFSSLQWFLETPVCGCFDVAIKRNFPSDVGKIRSATGVGGWAIWDQTAVWAMEDFPHKATHDTRKEIACDECVITVLCLCDHSECFVFIWFRS